MKYYGEFFAKYFFLLVAFSILSCFSSSSNTTTIKEFTPNNTPYLFIRYGSGSGLYAVGEKVLITADFDSLYKAESSFVSWTSQDGGTFDDPLSPQTTFTMPSNVNFVYITAHFLPGPPITDPSISVARRWMEVLLEMIRNDHARPTVHARNLFHLSAAMYDAWAAYSKTGKPYLLGDTHFGGPGTSCTRLVLNPSLDIKSAREEAISYAAWEIIRHRFIGTAATEVAREATNSLMFALDYNVSNPPNLSPAAKLGRCIGNFYIDRGFTDGSNEEHNYRHYSYSPINPPLNPEKPGNPRLENFDRWQPLELELFVDQSGHPIFGPSLFVTPEWGQVVPFALSKDDLTIYEKDGAQYFVYHDPGPPPSFNGSPGSGFYKWGFSLVSRWSSRLSPHDGVMIDISPASIGNIKSYPKTLEEYPDFYKQEAAGSGYKINPITGKPYESQIVPRGDYTRVLAEFWADGPESETPPGHWFVILNSVSDHDQFVRRFGGQGPELGALEWDVKSYFTLAGGMHDAAITAWGIKGWYDYIRPISAIRAMADIGQSTDPKLPSWSADGIPLVDGFIELVGPNEPLAGENGEHVNKIKLLTWRGPDFIKHPSTDIAGVGWILAENWWPYQKPSFVTPPFAGYVSGHSTYSRAGAEILTALTGSPYFPGGMSDFQAPANNFLVFEQGPSVDITLQWATYYDAADQCSLSRIYGGIHPPADDIPGRIMGSKVGLDAFHLAKKTYFEGSSK